ncbi:hypothetical protein [Abditibacterium utsteinense]|nr:hypothetical protein [Abditibacterium utsteinense]
MYELLLAIAASVAMGRLAEKDGHSNAVWGIITFVLCLFSLLIPIPFLRIGIACAVVFGLLTYTNKVH